MTTKTAWAVVDREGNILITTIRHSKQGSMNSYSSDWDIAIDRGYTCIPVTIKPKEDGE